MAPQLAVLISTLAECIHLEHEESTCASQLSILSPHPDVLITALSGGCGIGWPFILRGKMIPSEGKSGDWESKQRGVTRGAGFDEACRNKCCWVYYKC